MLLSALADACPFCKSATEAASAALGSGYSWSVLVMLAVPIVAVLLIATTLARSAKKEDLKS